MSLLPHIQQQDLFGLPAISRPVERIRAMNEAKARAEVGMDRAARKANRLHAGWCQEAVEALRKFAAGQHGMFLIETARVILARDLVAPADCRVWGKVTQMAIRAGYIEKTKLTAPAASSNAAPKPLFRRGDRA